MATAELDPAAGSPWLVRGLRRAWPRAYAAVWLSTLGSALLVALLGAGAKARIRGLLGLRLDAGREPPVDVAHVLSLAAHNIPIAAWPVLLGVLGAHHHRLARRAADLLLLACILANTLPAGAALGAYGTRLLPYIPQLPLEWAGLALGASAWILQRRRALAGSEGLALTALIVTVLLGAALLEIGAVPRGTAPRELPRSSEAAAITGVTAGFSSASCGIDRSASRSVEKRLRPGRWQSQARKQRPPRRTLHFHVARIRSHASRSPPISARA